jgi:Raf kinase inhibitor-like YbhB/YbcL family protein
VLFLFFQPNQEIFMGLISAIGKLTRPLRAGEDTLILSQPEFESIPETLEITSPAFTDGQPLPLRYTISGEDLSPPLRWGNVPSGTRELVLIVEDYDISLPKPMVHCIAYHLPPEGELREGALPSRNADALDPVPKLGRNGMGFHRYDGSAAPPGHGPHHYVFQFFAVSRELEFEGAPSKNEFLDAMKDHVLAVGRLTGTFER